MFKIFNILSAFPSRFNLEIARVNGQLEVTTTMKKARKSLDKMSAFFFLNIYFKVVCTRSLAHR